MGREWKIGDPVDGTTDGWMDAQNWGHGNDDEDDLGDIQNNPRFTKRDEYSKKAWDYYMDFKEEDALHYINMALDLDSGHSNNWNKKAIILEALKRYEESEKCYNKSLSLSKRNLVYDNKARMLYSWAVHLLEDSKKLPNGLHLLRQAYDIIIRALETLPGKNSEEDMDKYLRLRDSIIFYIDYESEFQRNLSSVKCFDKKVLFTITGRNFYNNDINLTHGLRLKLVKEPENEFDSDAIAVYVGDEKIGYVANSENTKFELTSSASELQDKFDDVAEGQYLYYLDRYADIRFAIGRII